MRISSSAGSCIDSITNDRFQPLSTTDLNLKHNIWEIKESNKIKSSEMHLFTIKIQSAVGYSINVDVKQNMACLTAITCSYLLLYSWGHRYNT